MRPEPLVGTLLDYPYPYSALLAISSDLDDTPTWDDYLELGKYLNTRSATAFGVGVGLEFANSLYMDPQPGSIGYAPADSACQARLRELIASGHIDTVHSFGDVAFSRADARRAIEHFETHGCCFPVWTDHARAPTNLGEHHMSGTGATPGGAAYCSDLLPRLGVTHVWRGQVSGIVGQRASSLRFDALAGRGQTAIGWWSAAKEVAKLILSAAGNSRYSMHWKNAVARRIRLHDGSQFNEFLRANAFPSGLPSGDSADALPLALSDRVIDQLLRRRGVMVLYTHLGRQMPRPGDAGHRAVRDALERLRGHQDAGRIRVLTTSRLLDYLLVRDTVAVDLRREGSRVQVRLDVAIDDPLASRAMARTRGGGLTVVVPSDCQVEVLVAGRAALDVKRAPTGIDGTAYAWIPMAPLEWPG